MSCGMLSAFAQGPVGLVQLVEQALASEPSLMAAKAELQAAEARLDQSVGGLLPQIRASANAAYNGRNYTTLPQPEDPRAVDPGTEDEQKAPSRGRAQAETERGRYNASGGEISMTLPLIRPAAWVDKRQSTILVEQAASELEATRQEVVHRVVSAWLEVQSAQLEQALTVQKELGAAQQLRLVQKGTALGAFAQPELEEAASRVQAARAERLAANSQLRLRLLALEHLVGAAVVVSTPPLDGADQPPWPDLLAALSTDQGEQALAALEASLLERNPSIKAAELAFRAAQQAVKRSQAGHWPTLDFTATASRNGQGLGTSAGQPGFRSAVGSVALDLRIPLYSGGIDSAKVRESVARLLAAEHGLEGARRKAVSELHQAWYAWLVARAKIEAGAQAVRAGEALKRQAEGGLRQGQKSEIDVMQARIQWLTAVRDLRLAQSDGLRSAVRVRTLLADLDPTELLRLEPSQTLQAFPPAGSTPLLGSSS
jgi:outer membrane protein